MSGITILAQSELPAGAFSRELEGESLGVPASVIFVDAAPGEGPSLHLHPYAELFFVLEGEATFTDGVQEHVVGAGSLVVVAPEQPHAFVPVRLRQIDVHLAERFDTRWLARSNKPGSAATRRSS
ncbi:MAG TPA: cupin domain-containing protein [Gaiellaceae bacterium]|nr:cupin domain-containing protein [Gaiellaceae bacterium]